MGQHYSLQETGIEYKMIAAYDNNAVANVVYLHNFGLSPTTTNLEHITAFPEADLWLLSPPCQPYTRGGRLLDDKDPRAAALLHLISVLEATPQPPQWIFLENVPNFERSRSRDRLVDALRTRGYAMQEFLISPLDAWVAIPNDRLRYYLAAERVATTSPCPEPGPIMASLSELLGPVSEGAPSILPIGTYLDHLDEEELSRHLVPQNLLDANPHYRHDIVTAASCRSATFTKAYGSKHLIGTGSLVQTKNFQAPFQPDDLAAISQLGLRFFTPREIARLHALPVDEGPGTVRFSFPPQTTIQQQYRLLGNSLNVRVVARILSYLLAGKRRGDPRHE